MKKVTEALDQYDFYTATRAIGTLVEDLSQWYVRRVRDRVRDGDAVALETLRETLEKIALLLAPLAPFVSEWAYQIVKGNDGRESVHLADWPQTGDVDQKSITNMERTRSLASEAFRIRQTSGIKVRQPLASLSIPEALPVEFAALLAEEVNVQEVIQNSEVMSLDTTLTPVLIEEGTKREFDRALAEARKTMGLSPRDKAHYELAEDGQYVVELPEGPKRFNVIIDAT